MVGVMSVMVECWGMEGDGGSWWVMVGNSG